MIQKRPVELGEPWTINLFWENQWEPGEGSHEEEFKNLESHGETTEVFWIIIFFRMMEWCSTCYLFQLFSKNWNCISEICAFLPNVTEGEYKVNFMSFFPSCNIFFFCFTLLHRESVSLFMIEIGIWSGKNDTVSMKY